MLKNFPLDKINVTKTHSLFLSRAPTHQSFAFNLQFLYKLKHKVHLSKTVCGIFHFRFHFPSPFYKRDTNADLKTSLYVRVHIKIISRKLQIFNPKNSRVINP